MKNILCKNRNEFIEYFSSKLMNNPCGIYFFLGKVGSGKKYVLANLQKKIQKQFKIYQVVSDAILEKKQRFPHTKFEFCISFTLHEFMEMSLSISPNTENTKINYIIENLKTAGFVKKNIFIFAPDYDTLSSEARDFLEILICNYKIIEENVQKNICIIMTGSNDYFSTKNNIIKVVFEDYTKHDLTLYLEERLNYSPSILTNEKINQVYKLCGTNFNLVNSYSEYIINSCQTNTSIEGIIDLKLKYYISEGYKYNLSANELKDILFISSQSIHVLTPQMISAIQDKNEAIVSAGFQCAVDEYFLDFDVKSNKYEYQNYYFISDKEKNYLCHNYILDKSTILIQYYRYLSEHYEDEYFERALFLFKYFGTISNEVFALLILALSKAFLIKDQVIKQSIISFIKDNCSDRQMVDKISCICNAYEEHFKGNYLKSETSISKLNLTSLNIVAAAEIRRLQFRNGQVGHIFSESTMNELAMILESYIDKNILLMTNAVFHPKEEKLLSLKILFDIAPYVLDTKNDIEKFNHLYDQSLILVNYIHHHFIRKSYADYIINVFNRKAFLFAAPSVSLVYYEQAESYFRGKNIFDELAITLASKAGMLIMMGLYRQSINNCEEAIQLIDEKNLYIEQKEKIYNNLFISQFLLCEQEQTEIKLLQKYAYGTIKKLETLLDSEANGKNHVILTNIASLCLYIGNEEKYLKAKSNIEMSLKCEDVSNIHDSSVNDFYRYHFAWFEFYRFLVKQDWNKCKVIIKDLTAFYPAIFHETEVMELRIKAAKSIISKKVVPDARTYSLNFLSYAKCNKAYSSCGLLLSDLQFTSW